MKNKITNLHDESIKLFVKINDIEQQIEIRPNQTLIVDDFTTKTMRVFEKRGFIKIELQNSNNETNEIKKEQKQVQEKEQKQVRENESRLEEVEREVGQYIEDGFIKGEWTDEDIVFLKKNYPTKGRKFCANQLNRTETSVQKKITYLNLKKKKKKKTKSKRKK